MSNSSGLGIPGVLGGAASAASYGRYNGHGEFVGSLDSTARQQRLAESQHNALRASYIAATVATGSSRRGNPFNISTSAMRYEVEEWLKDWDK